MSEPSQNITLMLLQDAQQEIGNLRSELFRTRQHSEERRQALESLQAENSQLNQTCQALELELERAGKLKQQLDASQQTHVQLVQTLEQQQREATVLSAKNAALQQQLEAESRGKQAAESAKAKLEFEKSKFQKHRDELAAQVRLAQQKARDAEEDQCRAEDEAAALRAELQALQAGGTPLRQSLAGSSTVHIDLTPELEAERHRTTTLYNTLTAAKAELHRLSQELSSTKEQLNTRDEQLTDTKAQLYQTERRLKEAEDELASCVAKINALQQQQREQPLPGSSGLHSSTANPTPSTQPASPVTPPPHQHASFSGRSASDYEDLSRKAEEAAALTKKVAAMKVARDKLLLELDRQMMEADKLAVENRALSEEVLQLRGHCSAWESQAQAAIAQLERLKDIIEESASWGTSQQQAAQEVQQQDQGQGAGAGAADVAPSQDVLQQVARTTELDLQVRALCAELARARGGTAAMGRSLLPVLQGVELRLAQLKAGAAPGVNAR